MKTDFLVIGSGIAGSNFALKASQYGKVTIPTKKAIMESNTNLAQGGIAAVTRKDDSFKMHIEDTLKVGCGLCNRKMVAILVKNGPQEIQSLVSFGVKFDKDENELHLSREAGHSKNRILHSGDTTGREIEQALTKRLRKSKQIEVLENCFAIDLFVKGGKCHGASVFDIKSKQVTNIFSKCTVLATGGVGYIYENTTNPEIATGDGVAMAYRGGAYVEDMEFVQFHPTTLNKEGAPHFLISETVRGEGAFLLDDKGERFMQKYDAMGELATRDVVSRAIFRELRNKRKVHLDLRHMGKRFILSRFPMIYQECLKYGVDIAKDLVPVSPAAHYLCGGIKINRYGETNIQNLLAFGECACTEVHGANRLASNSLLESVVFGSLGAFKAKKLLKNRIQEHKPERDQLFSDVPEQETATPRAELRKAMWNHVGITRNEKGLNQMLTKLTELERRIATLNENTVSVQVLELRNMLLSSNLVTIASLERKESRGTHYRKDYPQTDDRNWLRHICLKRNEKNITLQFV